GRVTRGTRVRSKEPRGRSECYRMSTTKRRTPTKKAEKAEKAEKPKKSASSKRSVAADHDAVVEKPAKAAAKPGKAAKADKAAKAAPAPSAPPKAKPGYSLDGPSPPEAAGLPKKVGALLGIAQDVLHIQSFRPGQAEAFEHLLAGEDLLAVM